VTGAAEVQVDPKKRTDRILVVDDDPAIRTIVEMALESEGFTVITARDGEEALALAPEARPDLVLLDVMMPRLDGLDVCRKLRARRETRYVCIILVTAKSAVEDKVEGLRAGADDYLTKPFDPGELIERVRVALRRSREMKDLNPLTSLPGNEQIRTQLRTRLKRSRPTALLYIDIDHFKAFNDRYGFLRGDKAIVLLSRCIAETLAARRDKRAFLGHIGGDDLAVITDPADAEPLAKDILEAWAGRVLSLYDEQDRMRGYIEISDRERVTRRYRPLTLSIGIATNTFRPIETDLQMADIATEMKQVAKKDDHCSWAVDRRRMERRQPGADAPRHGKEPLLLVDDDPDLRQLMRTALEEHFEIIEATDGVQAYLMAANKRPSIVIMDYRMPELDGNYAASLIREDVTDAKIIAVSGALESKPEWADAFLMKDNRLTAQRLRETVGALRSVDLDDPPAG
jgi:diguanylate cyclase (GGDEF)-like protein